MEKKIRFIDSRYHTLFYIDDGEEILVTEENGTSRTGRCHYLDASHFDSECGGYRTCYHICQWAEAMEKNGRTYAPAMPSYAIYQLDTSNGRWRDYLFAGTAELAHMGLSVEKEGYKFIYSAPLGGMEHEDPSLTLETIWTKFNVGEYPEDFYGHSLSVSDVIVLFLEGKPTAYFCDTVGFKKIPW